MIDCSLVAIPPLVLNGPPIGIALLKALAEENGYKCQCFNPSIDVWEKLEKNEKRTWPYTRFTKEFEEKYDVDAWVAEIVDNALAPNPKFIGLSSHTWSSEYFLLKISKRFKEVRPDLKLVLGGAAAMELFDTVRKHNDIDYIVVGDGEKAFLNCLEGKFDFEGLNTKISHSLSPEEFNNLPYPDFSDLRVDWHKAKNPKENRIYLIGSRGCVYNCSFCNVPTMMKYRFKDGAKFANEIRHMQNLYTPTNIEFGDSLINGSLREYKKLIYTLADLNKQDPVNKPKIVSFYRIRPEAQSPEEDFKAAAEAGFYRFKIGVESGSDQVRSHIGKQETNEDIEYTLRMMKKYGINANLLIIVGYPTETEKDFQETLDMLQMMVDTGLDSVVDRAVVNELYISTGTRISEQIDELGIRDAYGSAEEKMSRPWSVTLPNGEIIDEEVRERRLHTVLDFIENKFQNAQNLMVFSGKEDSSRNREGDKT